MPTPPNPLQIVESELESLLRQKAEIEIKIAERQEAIKILRPIYSATRLVQELADLVGDLGMTDRIRRVFASHPTRSLAPLQVRAVLEQEGLDMSGYSNVMATIHTILKRLKTNGELIEDAAHAGAALYKWSGLMMPPMPRSHLSGQVPGPQIEGLRSVLGPPSTPGPPSNLPPLAGPDSKRKK